MRIEYASFVLSVNGCRPVDGHTSIDSYTTLIHTSRKSSHTARRPPETASPVHEALAMYQQPG
jgi:hypothetical protein